ncbi:MAG: metal ABC transporter permease [Anaerolineae bacterium]|nr:metal ABC transporter permease [Phycisphaerae bacterium]
MNALIHAILNPWIWWSGSPSPGWTYGLETYWPIVVQGILVSVALGLIGSFLVVRGTSLLGDALSHSVLPGIVLGFLIGGSLHSPWILIGATAFGMLAALLVETVHSNSRVKEDASLGIIFTTLFAIGVVMINLYAGQADLDPGCVLYGNIEHFVINRGGMIPMAWILAAIVVAMVVFYRPLLVSTFDPELAQSLGIPARAIHYILMAALSLTVVASFEAVGAILAVALLIMPGATARLWTDRMPRMLIFAAAHGIVATLVGYWLSHEAVLNTSASGAITVAGFSIFMLSWLFAPKQGVLVQALVRRRLDRMIVSENLIKTMREISDGQSDNPIVPEQRLRHELRISDKLFTQAVNRGISSGWVERRPDRALALTHRGTAVANRLARAHVLWENFLEQKVGLPPDHVHDAAEWIEHHLNEENVRELDELLTSAPQRPQSE